MNSDFALLDFVKYTTKELTLIENDLINIMVGAGAKTSLRTAFLENKEGKLSLRKLHSNIKYHILQGNSILNTVEELNDYMYYSLHININNKKNKWRNKYENKDTDTNRR